MHDDTAGETGETGLVGREAELEELEELLDQVAAGAGVLLLIEGPAGIGKSALCAAIATRGERRAMRVRIAPDVVERGPVQPFTTVVRTLLTGPPSTPTERELTAQIARYRHDWATWSSPDQSEARNLVGELFVTLLTERAADGPSVIAFKDLHDADDASLSVLDRIAAGTTIPSTLLVASARPVPRRPELAAMVATLTRSGGHDIEVPPLTPAGAIALAENLIRHQAGPVLRARISAAGGNPQYVVDLITAAQESDALIESPDGVVELAGGVPLAHLNERLAASVAYLGEEALTLLAVAAVLGTSFVAVDLAAVAGIPETECWRVLRHGSTAGIVAARADRLTFRHQLIREALYAGLTPAARRQLHRRAAQTLFDAGAPAVVVQEHLDRAEDPGWDEL